MVREVEAGRTGSVANFVYQLGITSYLVNPAAVLSNMEEPPCAEAGLAFPSWSSVQTPVKVGKLRPVLLCVCACVFYRTNPVKS